MTINLTGYTYDPRCLLHDTGVDEIRLPSGHVLDPEPHPSSLRILRRTAQLVRYSGLLNDVVELRARPAHVPEITRVHDRAYVDRVRELAARGGGVVGDDTAVATGTWDAALVAAGTAIGLTDVVVDGTVRNAFGLVRPPGHHAGASTGGGFSIFNNVALAARHVLGRGLERVVIVDWDVHHGDGTQEVFWDDASVLVISLHQEGWYASGSGGAEEVGGRGAEGRTVNVALPPGTGDRGYELAFDEVVRPAISSFSPEFVLVSAGQDASFVDPLGRMMVTAAGFRRLATAIAALADEHCEGRLVALNEGGYSPGYTPFCTLAVLEGLVGVRTEVDDPLEGTGAFAAAATSLREEQQRAVAASRDVQRRYRER